MLKLFLIIYYFVLCVNIKILLIEDINLPNSLLLYNLLFNCQQTYSLYQMY